MSDCEALLEKIRGLHTPMLEEDFVQIPPVDVKVCSSCYQGNDDFHMTWPCETARLLGETE